jgi:uncharacterized repeat protein (TIGR03803 family)
MKTYIQNLLLVLALLAGIHQTTAQAQNLFESDFYGGKIYEFTTNGTQSTFATGVSQPTGLAFNSAGILFELDAGSGNIFEFTTNGTQSTFASGLNSPQGLAFDTNGNLFVSDAGSGNIFEFTNGIAAEKGIFASGLHFPFALAFNSAGDLFVADGSTVYEYTPLGAQSTLASVHQPIGLAFDSAGDLFVADAGDNESGDGNIYEFTNNAGSLSPNYVTFVSGLYYPDGLAFDSAGNLFESDGNSGNIFEFTTNGTQITFASGLSHPSGLAFGANFSAIITNSTPPAAAQTFTTLHSFTDGNDGGFPTSGLILSSNTLYGTTHGGGSSGDGVIFAVNTDGSDFTTLHSFTATTYSEGSYNNSDGAFPYAGFVLSGNTLYGTAFAGGNYSCGTVFSVNTDGSGFTTLHSFSYLGNDGENPVAGLILSGNTLYGTTESGGIAGNGTIFAINTDGSGYTNLYSFTSLDPDYNTNTDGAYPYAGLILLGNTLYGTAANGGSSGLGTVFAVNTDGSDFTTLHNFSALDPTYNTNSDGAYPYAGLILSGNTLYGTAQNGGSSDRGTVFAVNTDGSDFKTLHSFTALDPPYFTNSDGLAPDAGLILLGNTLYGTAQGGGSSHGGTVFAVNTDGADFTNLYNFTGGNDGLSPQAGLILSGSTLYGTAANGGSSDIGTVFSLTLPSVTAIAPQLAIILSGSNVILTWPTNASGFTLQSTTNLVSPAVWSAVSPAPVAINTNNVVTNFISGAQMFYRLSQ